MISQLPYLIWARGLGEQSEVLAEIAAAALNTTYTATIRPQSGFDYAVVHRVTLAMPMPEDSGRPIARAGSLTTTDTAYADVVTWTVADDYSGWLHELSVDSTDFARANFRVTIGGTQQFIDFVSLSGFDLPFPRGQLPEAAVVRVQAASTDGTSITVKGIITGKEFPPYIFEIRPRKGGNVTPHVGYSTADIIRDGVFTWAYISKSDVLQVDVINRRGIGGEHFLAYFWCINVPSAAHLEEIKRLALQVGVQEVLPFGFPQAPGRPAAIPQGPQVRVPVQAR